MNDTCSLCWWGYHSYRTHIEQEANARGMLPLQVVWMKACAGRVYVARKL